MIGIPLSQRDMSIVPLTFSASAAPANTFDLGTYPASASVCKRLLGSAQTY